jgi:hypothetical protein
MIFKAGSTGKHYYSVEVAIRYRTVLEVSAVDEEDAEAEALKKLSQRDILDSAELLVEVQK